MWVDPWEFHFPWSTSFLRLLLPRNDYMTFSFYLASFTFEGRRGSRDYFRNLDFNRLPCAESGTFMEVDVIQRKCI